MKVRTGFVSNSSCSSFVIQKEWVSPAQIKLIKNHIHKGMKEGNRFGGGLYRPAEDDAWAIHETATTIEGSTIIDNFDMHSYLEFIGVDMSKVEFDDHYADWHEWGEL